MRKASSAILPLMVRAVSATWITLAGTCRACSSSVRTTHDERSVNVPLPIARLFFRAQRRAVSIAGLLFLAAASLDAGKRKPAFWVVSAVHDRRQLAGTHDIKLQGDRGFVAGITRFYHGGSADIGVAIHKIRCLEARGVTGEVKPMPKEGFYSASLLPNMTVPILTKLAPSWIAI